MKWQRVHRLIGSTGPGWIVDALFLDSLLFLRALPADVSSVLDLGAGAGFPGVPMKIVRGDLRLVLVEARQRRASFLSTVVRELELDRTVVHGERAEVIGDRLGGPVDAVVMRCAGPAADLAPLALSLVRPGGVVVAAAADTATTLPGAQRVVVTVDGRVGRRAFLVWTRDVG